MPSAPSPRILGHSDFGDYERQALSKGHNVTLKYVIKHRITSRGRGSVQRQQVHDDNLKKEIHTRCS